MTWEWDYRDLVWDFQRGHWKQHYQSWPLKKKRSGRRWIHAPLVRLKELQRLLNKELMQRPVHPAAKAFLPGCDHLKAAQEHLEFMRGHGWLFKTDIQNFFGHVTGAQLIKLGLPANLVQMITIPSSLGRVLPQGGVTSPVASNLAMVEFDEIVTHMAVEHDLHYTRYADDIAFSGRYNFGYRWPVKILREQLQNLGMKIALRKTKITPPGGRQVYLGVMLNSGGNLRVMRRDLQILKGRFLDLKHGEDQETSVAGVLSYVQQVNPAQYQTMLCARARINGAIHD